MKRFSIAIAAALILAGIVAPIAVSADDSGRNDEKYLALGDSVSFGFITQAGPQYVNAANFLGYPEFVGIALRTGTVNASCPGETTSSFLLGTDDNGCAAFRSRFPLHVPYKTTQLQFATSFLRAHRDTKLVTITLGANDMFRMQAACFNDPTCMQARLPATLASIEVNVRTIIEALRGTGFDGTVIVTMYYSTDYADPVQGPLTQALNGALARAARAEGAQVADGFDAFAGLATRVGGHTCFTGLLNVAPGNQTACDVHPSITGQELLAQTVVETFGRR